MTKKYYLILGVIVILILIVFGISFFIKQQKPAHFLYQSPSEKIPEDFLIAQNQRLDTDLIFQTKLFSDEFYCKTLNAKISRLLLNQDFYSFRHKAKKIEYFSYSAPNVEGSWHRRYAVVCGNNYWIVDRADPWGMKIYGPFEK